MARVNRLYVAEDADRVSYWLHILPFECGGSLNKIVSYVEINVAKSCEA